MLTQPFYDSRITQLNTNEINKFYWYYEGINLIAIVECIIWSDHFGNWKKDFRMGKSEFWSIGVSSNFELLTSKDWGRKLCDYILQYVNFNVYVNWVVKFIYGDTFFYL